LSLDDLQFRWLPMAHSFGKVLLSRSCRSGFPCAVDGRVDKIVDNLGGRPKPTFMGAAPRIFEKAHAVSSRRPQSAGGAKAKIFDRAFVVGLAVSEPARRAAGPAAARGTAQGVRPARVLQGPRSLRWPGCGSSSRCGGAQPRRSRVVSTPPAS
jgi:long-chain acyl-CoA synthetase